MENVFLGELDLSQVASRIGWEFLTLGRGKLGVSPKDTAEHAIVLCSAVQAAEALVSGTAIGDTPAIDNIPATRRRMLLAEGGRRALSVSRLRKIRDFAFMHNDVIQGIANGSRDATPSDVDKLRQHFALLSLSLAEVGL
ncbi:MAG: hypothetical protein ACYDG5_01375 [Dehalococcoidales bacterium]